MIPAIFIPTSEEKEKAGECCTAVIDIIEKTTGEEDILFKAFILQMLMDTFEDVTHMDIRRGITISKAR